MEALALIYLAGFVAELALCIFKRKRVIPEVMKIPEATILPSWALGLAMAVAFFFVSAFWPARRIIWLARKL